MPSPLDVLSIDIMEWAHPVTEVRSKHTVMVDEGSLKTTGKTHMQSAPGQRITSNLTGVQAWDMFIHE